MSQPPENPGNPAGPHGGDQNPPGYPPPPGYGGTPPPPPGYGPPPGGYYPPGPPPGQPGYGAPPPGYGPPGGYGGPPPPPGYGPPQPGYPQPGYGQPPGQPFSIGEAFGWAWNKFGKNAMPLIVSALLYFVIGVVLHGLVFVLLGGANLATVDTNGTNDAAFSASTGSVGTMVLGIVMFVYGIFVEAAFLSGALDLADGRPVTVSSFFKPRNFGKVILAAVLLSAITVLLDLVSFIPPTIVFGFIALLAVAVFSFFALFTIAFATDRGLSAVGALMASFSTVRSNAGSTLLSWVVQAAVVFVGALLCGIGLIVAGPVALLIQVYTYRKLSGGQVAPLTQGYQQGPPPGYQPT
jgi:uncharacterized membrane protein